MATEGSFSWTTNIYLRLLQIQNHVENLTGKCLVSPAFQGATVIFYQFISHFLNFIPEKKKNPALFKHHQKECSK